MCPRPRRKGTRRCIRRASPPLEALAFLLIIEVKDVVNGLLRLRQPTDDLLAKPLSAPLHDISY